MTMYNMNDINRLRREERSNEAYQAKENKAYQLDEEIKSIDIELEELKEKIKKASGEEYLNLIEDFEAAKEEQNDLIKELESIDLR